MKTLRLKKSVMVSTRQKQWLYVTFAILWVSGSAWLLATYVASLPILFDPPLWLKIHGAAGFAFLLILGALLQQHVPAGWKENRQRPSGILLIAGSAFLILTGWGLYYVGGDTFRHALSISHSWLGVLLPLAIVLHVWVRR